MSSSTNAPPPPTVANLPQALSLLDAFARRNKNQHRRSAWWHSFNSLRRSVRRLAASLTPRPNGPAVVLGAEYLIQEVTPAAYIAFAHLAADNQHAILGLFLLALLARTHTLATALLLEHKPPQPSQTPTLIPATTPSNALEGSRSAPRPTLTPGIESSDRGVAISRAAFSIPTTKKPTSRHESQPKRKPHREIPAPDPDVTVTDNIIAQPAAESKTIANTVDSAALHKHSKKDERRSKKKSSKRHGTGTDMSSLFSSIM